MLHTKQDEVEIGEGNLTRSYNVSVSENVFLGQTNPPVILSVLDIILILDLPSRLFFVEPPQNIRHQQKIFSNHDIQRVIQVEPFNFNFNRFSRTGDEKEDSDETQDKITQHDKSQ